MTPEIVVTKMHGDDRHADDGKRRGAALLIWDNTPHQTPGWFLRWDDMDTPIDGDEHNPPLTHARRLLGEVTTTQITITDASGLR